MKTKINKILIIHLISHIQVFLILRRKDLVKMILKIIIIWFAKQSLKTIMELMKKNKDYQRIIYMIHSILTSLIQVFLTVLKWILKKHSRIFQHFLFSLVFLIFIITDHTIIKIKLMEMIEIIFKLILVNTANQSHVIQTLKITNTWYANQNILMEKKRNKSKKE